MPVLYRKYRPQRFADVVGQAPIVQTLKNAVKSGSVAHAYLFTGSRGVGKTSVARILAKAVNCAKPKDGDADGTCEICLAIAENNFLDLVEIDAASNTGVENVRELIEHVKFKPSRARYKVFIIDEVHMLSKAAFNALLKTLEEPPEHAIFILATTDIHKVPETIISRTQRFDFRKISEAGILEHLKEIAKEEKLASLGDDVLQLIAAGAEGGLRDALSLLDKLSALNGTGKISLGDAQALLGLTSIKLSQELVDLVAARDAKALPTLFDRLLEQGTDFAALNRDLLEYLRKLLVCKVTGDAEVVDLLPQDREILRQTAGKFQLPELLHLVRLFLRSYKEAAQAPSPELPLLLAAVEASLKPEAGVKPAAQPASRPTSEKIAEKAVDDPPAPRKAPEPGLTELAMPKPAEQPEGVAVEMTYDEVASFWPELIDKIKLVNSPLATLLKNSPLQDVSNGTITIGVKYLFHKEHLESKKNYSLVTGIITEICGKHVRLLAKITKIAEEAGFAQSMDAVGSALQIFGGELVE
jgi:DNA polymerase III subunit gamma/tau